MYGFIRIHTQPFVLKLVTVIVQLMQTSFCAMTIMILFYLLYNLFVSSATCRACISAREKLKAGYVLELG